MLLIRVDGNETIGSGHIVRCAAIAQAAIKYGHDVVFAVSDSQSAQLVDYYEYTSVVLGGNPFRYSSDDGKRVAEYVRVRDVSCILIDSYAVNDLFFRSVAGAPCKVAYIDDVYTYETGLQALPSRWKVDCVINYGFGSSEKEYQRVYSDQKVDLMIGPRFAPVRKCFINKNHSPSNQIHKVLVTCGSTNPAYSLERITQACLEVLPDAQIDVVIGKMAKFDSKRFSMFDIKEHRGISDLSRLMSAADLVISAAGTTLYELCSIGVPTIALPIVGNQLANAHAFSFGGIGLSVESLNWRVDDVVGCIERIVQGRVDRNMLQEKMKSTVDGLGAARIASSIL